MATPETIEFFIPFTVVPKQGDRARVAGNNGRQWVQHYTSTKVRKNAEALTTLCAQHRPAEPFKGPVRLWLAFTFPYRKSEPKKNRNGWIPKDTAPDMDNLEKQMVDVLERTGFFANDAQVAEKHSAKGWKAQGGVRVCIEKIRQRAEQ